MKYVCTICGYIYDEAVGSMESGIPPNTSWDALPADWVCPICKAPKDVFEKEGEDKGEAPISSKTSTNSMHVSWDNLVYGALCSGLAKGCEKQYLSKEAALYYELAAYFEAKAAPVEGDIHDLSDAVSHDLDQLYPAAHKAAEDAFDRGAKRVLVWSEKANRIQASLLKRYENEHSDVLRDTKIFVCEICGFVYIGDTPPAVCPVCKVPAFKLTEVERG